MERMTKWLLLTLLSLLALILVGSSRNSRPRPETTDAERAALVLSEQVLPSDRDQWEKAARRNPLWLIRASLVSTAD